MAKLSILTDAAAVEAAAAECRSVGADVFRARGGFDPSRDFFLRLGDELFDTKPVVAAAIRIQHPHLPELTARDFSGGSGGAVRALERLGFEVVTRAQLKPPTLGIEFADRTAVAAAYGGDKVSGIIRFPGEDVVNIFSDASGPYADDTPTLTESFGYRGEGANGDQEVEVGGNALLERARVSGEAVRFWYKPRGGEFAFLSWAAVIGRSWVCGKGQQDGLPRAELEWQVQAVPSRDPAAWPAEVERVRQEADATAEDDSGVPEAQSSPSYAELLARVQARGQRRRSTGIVRADFQRSAAARRAVLLRCEGKCESPRCGGMPTVPNRRGEPILDVDHIKDLALGGDDDPQNMVALCPNCHAVKTRGANIATYRRELLRVVAAAHQRQLEAVAAAKTLT